MQVEELSDRQQRKIQIEAEQRSCARSPATFQRSRSNIATDGAVVTASALGCSWGWAVPVNDPNAEIYRA